ncbi:MAG: holliday junction helicase RuvA [Bacteroidota bacterium]|nr:holliday junction helicase RuvA [Bacteroidota bacterium]
MIALLRGKLIAKNSTEVIIDCGGVGYSAFISVNTSANLPDPGNEISLHTLLIPKEDALLLFGFSDTRERELFKMLTSIPGIGPKTALGILSAATINELQEYVLTGNLPALTKLPGIGKKTAERINLELKDKISKIPGAQNIDRKDNLSIIIQEAVSALLTLGFSRASAEKAVRDSLSDNKNKDISAEQIIKLSLRYMTTK